jgi:hypothetical protein
MSYLDKSLLSGEKALHTFRTHWIVLFMPAMAGLFFAMLGCKQYTARHWNATGAIETNSSEAEPLGSGYPFAPKFWGVSLYQFAPRKACLAEVNRPKRTELNR